MPKKILVVDDEEDLVEMVKRRLETNQYEVVTAHDGEAGLAKAKQEAPDLILLDLMMPKMDGYKVCALLKKDTRYAKIPILMFTAKASENDRQLSEEVGADGYLTKPFEAQTLLAKIAELLASPESLD